MLLHLKSFIHVLTVLLFTAVIRNRLQAAECRSLHVMPSGEWN